MDYQNYVNRVYASWLGKLIGIRLGAPVESWTKEKIEETYGTITGYPVDYDIFAADDDSNGPLFFVKVLEDYDPFHLKGREIGDTILNYLQEYHGFFWWGGVGVSTEHTAYENLKKGILSPESGSEKQNGIEIAEQIGGQIFSDCWGYVSLGNPQQAKELAIFASSATHDKAGIEGGIFVAVCIAIAPQCKDIYEVMEKALNYLDPSLSYYQIVVEIMDYYKNHPDNWQDCFDYIYKNHGYDKYPGVCHIIPNTALMIMAMCYGQNDFSKTLNILCQSGWDTDCNCGNVGSIMGALLGLEGIEERWITPLNDILNSSSMIGYDNIDTISNTTYTFAKLAFILSHREKEIIPVSAFDFSLPYATKGFRIQHGILKVENSTLKVISKQNDIDLYRYTYYMPNVLYDNRYDPCFSPVIYPNDVVSFELTLRQPAELVLYIEDADGKQYIENRGMIHGKTKIVHHIPKEIPTVITKVGMRIQTDEITLSSYKVEHTPDISYDLKRWPSDNYGSTFSGTDLINVRGFVAHSGEYQSTEKGLLMYGKEHAFLTTGSPSWDEIEYEAKLIPLEGYHHYMVFGCQGWMNFMAFGLEKDKVVIIKKYLSETVFKKVDFSWDFQNIYILKTIIKGGIIKLAINGQVIFTMPTNEINTKGICGFYTKENSKSIWTGFELKQSV